MHLLRVMLFAAVLGLIHYQHHVRTQRALRAEVEPLSLTCLQPFYPGAESTELDDAGSTLIRNAAGDLLGYAVQTSPQADRTIGFSGPTNVLLAFDPHDTILAARILESRDTREHVAQIEAHPDFLGAYVGLSRDRAARRTRVDAVAGATLTSLAIAESIVKRLGGAQRSLKFPDPVAVSLARKLFPAATRVTADEVLPDLWQVYDAQNSEIGKLLRTSPAADNIIGYQGPTDALLGLSAAPRAESPETGPGPLQVTGLTIGHSFDNEPYVTYVREDRYFLKLFNGRTLAELRDLDLRAAGVEGVSGATMTSLAVAEGIIAAARSQLAAMDAAAAAREAAAFRPSPRDIGTLVVTLVGVLISLSPWRGASWVRIPFLLLLVVYLGFMNGDLLSQALLAGWARNGVPWRTMSGMLVLTVAAFAAPIFARRNVYCSHLCPHGAVQQLLMNRLPWRLRLGARWHRALSLIPGLLLLWVVIVSVAGWTFSLVDLEPFDAYVPSIAGWPALVLFIVGLAASLVTPMAYCQYGCPTGALLGYLRRHTRSDELGARDLLAGLCLIAAIAMAVVDAFP